MYKNKIVYCDFKFQNVVIDNDYKSKLIDFAFACKTDTNIHLNVVNIALKNTLLQKYFIKYPCNQTSNNIFKLGVILFKLVNGKCPIKSANIKKRYDLISKDGFNQFWKEFSNVNVSNE